MGVVPAKAGTPACEEQQSPSPSGAPAGGGAT